MSTDYTASRDERLVIMYSRTSKVLGGIQYTMNSRKTQVNKKLKSINKQIININRRLTNNAPVAISTKKSNTGKDYYRTQGRERISNITALSQDFDVKGIFINPANQDLFPWLSGIGRKYDLYHFKRLKFSYVPALPTSEEGNVYIGLDYNTLDPAPASSNELCQLSHWSMNVVWKPNSLVIDLNNIGWLYTRSGPVANADYKTYDLGKLFVAIEGVSFDGTAGYIDVEYDVEFKRRQPDYTNSVTPVSDIFPPVVYLTKTNLASRTRATTFNDGCYTNSSIINIEASEGRFSVTQDCKVIITLLAQGTDGIFAASDTTGPVLYQSDDGSTYTAVPYNGNLRCITLMKGKFYSFYNAATNSLIALNVSMFVVSLDV